VAGITLADGPRLLQPGQVSLTVCCVGRMATHALGRGGWCSPLPLRQEDVEVIVERSVVQNIGVALQAVDVTDWLT